MTYMNTQEWSPDELRIKAERYCATAERCESEVRIKLRQWNCDPKNADEIVDFLRSGNFINDLRYACAYVHDKLAYQGWGRVKIESMLRSKKLPLPTIREALNTIDENEYFKQLKHLISIKSFNALLLRGFTAEEIKQASPEAT